MDRRYVRGGLVGSTTSRAELGGSRGLAAHSCSEEQMRWRPCLQVSASVEASLARRTPSPLRALMVRALRCTWRPLQGAGEGLRSGRWIGIMTAILAGMLVVPPGAWGQAVSRGSVDHLDPSSSVRVGRVQLVRADGTVSAQSSIQSAVDLAAEGDTVLLSDGVFFGAGNRDVLVTGKNIVIRSQNGPSASVIDCQGLGRAFWFDGPSVTSATVLSGVTITRGYDQFRGGGILCMNSSSPLIERCVVLDSKACRGGGLFYSTVAGEGMGEVRDCLFRGNEATDDGGGVYTGSSVVIDRCVMIGNRAGILGGGADVGFQSVVRNCVFAKNDATGGGGLSGGNTVEGCTFVDNTAATGGALELGVDPFQTVSNCILWGNTALPGQGAQVAYTNFFGGGLVTLDHCVVEGGIAGLWVSCLSPCNPPGYSLINVLDVDPEFVDVRADDYHLSPTSPCIDAGDPGFVPDTNEADFDYEPRLAGVSVDIGSDETWPGTAHTLVFPGRANEVNFVTVRQATPGALVHFFYGTSSGRLPLPFGACPTLELGILDPQFLCMVVADANGEATYSQFVPAASAGQSFLHQAIEFDPIQQQCFPSNVVAYCYP